MERILITGACGQLGTELTIALCEKFGCDNVFISDIISSPPNSKCEYIILDATDKASLKEVITKKAINQVYHLAAILSANGERNPQVTWNLNMTSLLHVLELGTELSLNKIFWPSSIAVFGPSTPKTNCSQDSVCEPATMYGITKRAGEHLCSYYSHKYGLDVRSLRYPGLISYNTPAGGGTTDYAVEIFHKAVLEGQYKCYLEKDTLLPMMYMPDAVKATMMLMDAKKDRLSIRSAYNVSGFSFSPQELARAIQKYIPGFKISYQPDFRQQIAQNWPDSINDDPARKDWGWSPRFTVDEMAQDILNAIAPAYPLQ